MRTASAANIRPALAEHQLGVLLVEDDAVQLMDMAQSLVDAGMTVFEASNVDEALSVLGTRADVRVMITDVDLRGGELNGYQLAKLVAARWPEVGLLIVTGHSRPKVADLPEGARFVANPCAPSALTGNIFDFVSQQSGGI